MPEKREKIGIGIGIGISVGSKQAAACENDRLESADTT